MSKTQKIISLLLSVIMIMSVFTIVPFTASAAEAEAATTAETEGDYEYDVLDDNTAEITVYTGEGGEVTIPSTLGGYTVTSIGIGAFYENTDLKSVTIPDSVTSIGNAAFYGCTDLTNITIPDSVISIDHAAFEDTAWYDNQPDGLVYAGKVAYCLKGKGTYPAEIVIKDGTLSISEYMFSYCEKLTNVTIPDSVMSIGRNAFEYCSGLTDLTIPDSVTSIGEWAFAGCTGLTSLTIPDSVTSIGEHAFFDCTGLTSIDIPNYITSIDSDTFCGCTGLTSVTIPDSVTNIDSGAFGGCTGLTSITIPDSVTSIGGGAFDNSVWENSQPDGLVYAGKVVYIMKGDCPAQVVIKDGTLGIAGYAFFGCTGLTNVTIPDSVTSIGSYAFDGCTGLTRVTIPDSVTSIDYSAFGYYTDYIWKRPVDGFTIYGYEDSEAENYAKENEFTFVPLKSKTDEATGIILAVPEDTGLNIMDITADINPQLPDGCNKMAAYDITLTKDGEAVQPDNTVTVKIPCTNENAKVYRFEADGTMTDMNAKYKDGYMVFTTDHFSIYVLAEPNVKTGATVSGTITSYVDDSDVTIKLTGADNNFTAETNGKADYSIEAVPAGEYTLTVS